VRRTADAQANLQLQFDAHQCQPDAPPVETDYCSE